MKMMMTCPRCQNPLDADAPRGLCPICLLMQGSESADNARRGPFKAPSLDELSALFPELELLEKIGQGGMGVVYKAAQPELDRMVALKILPREVAAEPEVAERFTREAQALAQLNHPGIVAIYEQGQRGELTFFLMEYAEGKSLERWMAEGSLPPARALKIMPRICEALQYAHEAGVVHRDIKPANIILGADDQVKIADFGLAKLREPSLLSLTGAGHVLGTPHYMAPEQIEKPETVDHRADIYALGVVFYELLTGELPLGRFARPSEKVSVDARIDEVVFKALEKDPVRRFASAELMSQSLSAALSGAPLPYKKGEAIGEVMEPAGSPRRRSVVARRCRYGLVGSAWVLIGILCAVVGNALFYFDRVSRDSDSMELELLKEREQALLPKSEATAAALAELRAEIQEIEKPASPKPWSAYVIAAVVLLPITLSSPIGATICGLISFRRIRRSAGRLVGLPWAIFAAVFWPLSLVNGLMMLAVLPIAESNDELSGALLPAATVGMVLVDVLAVWLVARIGMRPA